MSIRVTNGYIVDQTISDINDNLKKLQDIQLKLSTGNDINKPSDDPVGVLLSLRYQESLEETGQYQRNIADGKSRMQAAMSALERVEELILEIQGLAQDTVSTGVSIGTTITATEIDGLINEIYLNANAKFLGKYIFGGEETLTAPYQANLDTSGNMISVTRNRLMDGSTEVRGIDDKIHYEVAEGQNVQINISGSAPFMPNGENGTNDVFATLINLRDSVMNNDIDQIKNYIADLEDEYENVIVQIAKLGERSNSIENTRLNNEEQIILKQENLSEILNVDFAKAISDLNYQEFVLQSSLQIGARIIPPSLLDFI